MTQITAFRRAALLAALALSACAGPREDDANVARGRGMRPAGLGAAAEAAVLDAAARATFDVEPGLVLRLHTLRLPRTAGWAGGDSVPVAVVQALGARGLVAGVCTPRRDAPRNTPRCEGPQAGYLLRGSEVLRVGGDTVQVYLAAERFGPAAGQRPEALRLEKIYQLVGAGDAWRVVREARAKVE